MTYELSIDCPSDLATIQVGEKLAAQLKNGEMIELIGDVGSGKTTLVKGLARGLGSQDTVSSPSFAIKNVYEGGKFTLFHFDLYRLEEPGLVLHEVEDALKENGSVAVIEWAVEEVQALSGGKITVRFEITGENSRRLRVALPEKLEGAR